MQKNKYFLLIILFIQVLSFNSCNHESVRLSPMGNIPIIDTLPTFECELGKEDSISFKEIQQLYFLANSQEEVKNNVTEAFLKARPEYLDIDFDTYSLLAVTEIFTSSVVDRQIKVLRNQDSTFYQINIVYTTSGDTISDKEALVNRIGFVVDKISPQAKIEVSYSSHANTEE